MIETIPKDLENSHTSIVEGIPIISLLIKSNKDLLILTVLTIPSLLIFMLSNLPVVPKLIILGTSLLTSIITILIKLPQKITNLLVLHKSLKQTGYNSQQIKEFLPIEDIKHDTLHLKDNRHIRILESDGINLHLYEKDHQNNIIEAYKTFLNSLDFPIQIISKSETININKWLNSLDKRVKTKQNIYKPFRKFIQNYIEENKIKRRRYFIVFENKPSDFNIKDNFKFLFFGVKPEVKDKKTYDELENKETVIISMCKKFGITAKRLNTKQLTNLIMSYYNEESSNHEDFLSPVIYSQEENYASA